MQKKTQNPPAKPNDKKTAPKAKDLQVKKDPKGGALPWNHNETLAID